MSEREQTAYPTAQTSPDAFGLGRTSGQRGAEILAGLRAELLPSPESLALARFGGRAIARLAMAMEKNPAALNFVVGRLNGITELVRRALSPNASKLLLMDIAAGFSPRGIQLAQSIPTAQVVEVDLPDVVRDKEARLRRARNLQVPTNLSWRSADLAVTALAQVVEKESADVISAEGLNAYLAPEDITRTATRILECLKPGGTYISDIPWAEGMDYAQQATRFFSRQAGVYKGVIDSAEAMRDLMLTAGYKTVIIHKPSEVAAELKLPTPILDFSFFVVAQR